MLNKYTPTGKNLPAADHHPVGGDATWRIFILV